MAAIGSEQRAARIPALTSSGLARHIAALSPTMWLVAIVAVSSTARFALGLTSPVPWIMPDELIYGHLARSFANSGEFIIRGLPFSALSFGPLYPIVISPAYLLGSTTADAYGIARLMNAVLISTAAVPGYLIARRYVTQRTALIFATLVVLVPSAIYSTKIMTENLCYPIFLFTIVAMLRAIERPSRSRDLVAIGAIVLAVLTRAQMVVLLPAFVTAIALLAVVERSDASGRSTPAQRIRAHRTLWSVLAAGTAGSIVTAVVHAGSLSALLGAHTALLHRIRPADLPLWLVYHVADLFLYTGVIPLAAFVVVAIRSLVIDPADEGRRVFAAVATAVSAWLLLLIALYGTQRTASQHVFDRYLFYLAPLFLLALFIWIEAGLPRPRRTTMLAAATAMLLPVTLPFGTLLNGREWGTSSSTVSMLPWVNVGAFTGHGWLLRVAVAVFSTGLTVIFLRATVESSARVVRIVALYWIALSVMTVAGSANVAALAEQYSVGDDPSWVDRTVGQNATVPVIWAGQRRRGEVGAYALWEAEFFNRSVSRVFTLHEILPDRLPSRPAVFRNGTLTTRNGRAIHAHFMLADIKLAGRVVYADRRSGLTLYEIDGPVRRLSS